MKIRVGIGYDVHRLSEGYELWLGGIMIEHDKGLVGHSDADVLIHAICDALLGAANMCDIGFHFSDKDPKYKGIDSKRLLKSTVELLSKEGWVVNNVDATLCMQKPKIMAYIPDMKRVLEEVMGVEAGTVSIKATTTEHLGFEGREEGVSAMATALIVNS